MANTPQALKRLRRQNRMTQRELARCLGVSLQTVKNWEQGRRGVARRYHGALDAMAPASKQPKPRVNSRPQYADIDVGDWAAASKFATVELKYDGHYTELRGGPDGWELLSRTGRLIASGAEPLPVCHLLCEHIDGTEWAQASPLRGTLVAWGALSRRGVHLSRPDLEHLVSALSGAGVDVVASEQRPVGEAQALWAAEVEGNGWEGIVLRTRGGRFARMKRRATMDYIATAYDGVSITGALYNGNGKPIDLVRVPYDGEVKIGDVFEASGLRVFKSGSLRNPRFSRWRPDKPAADCTMPIDPE